jgi:hypothetical protein
VGQCSNEEERAEGISLGDALFQSVAYSVIDIEGGKRVGSKVYTRGLMIEEAKP